MDIDGIQRAFFDALYTYRIEVAIASMVTVSIVVALAWRRGWLTAARRHPARTVVLVMVGLAIVLPLGYYTASPLWIRTALVEPEPDVIVDPTPVPSLDDRPVVTIPVPSSSARASARPALTPFVPRRVTTGMFHGTDDFHFARGTATISETAPGRFTLRLADFSVRNGPDLYVYLSPSADDYGKGALELGKLKATDGSFGYELPVGVDTTDFASAIIWCKQFSHLFAVAPLAAS